MAEHSSPKLHWDFHTAIDLFVSLNAMHSPAAYGIRPAWAAGVRSRFSADTRDVLQLIHAHLWIPVNMIRPLTKASSFISEVVDPANGQRKNNVSAFLAELEQIPPSERLLKLVMAQPMGDDFNNIARDVAARGRWLEADATRLAKISKKHKGVRKKIEAQLEFWANIQKLSSLYLDALRQYVDVFFAEEEARITPMLTDSIENAQAMAGKMGFIELVETLSQGIEYNSAERYHHFTIVPCFWSTPLIIDYELTPNHLYFIYGAKPANVSLVPGQPVPDSLTQTLKALSDPTRLKILRQLAIEPTSPADLARHLRLRPPTVTHHLQILRLARLVRLTLNASERRLYTIRPQGVNAMTEMLYQFLILDRDSVFVDEANTTDLN